MNEWGLFVFFTIVFAVFYTIAFSVWQTIRDNYYRYAQKADLQWTGPRRRTSKKSLSWVWRLVFSILTSWLVVRFLILP